MAAPRSLASSCDSSRTSHESNPYSLASSTSSLARSSCAADLANVTVPPLAQWQSRFSLIVTLPTSLTVCCIARYMAMACSRPAIRSSLPSDAGNSAEHHPPLRPDAPNPAISCSQSTTDSRGSSW